jgi:endonuclease/exonuclease/phosphatase family metal-dependent hydrolase
VLMKPKILSWNVRGLNELDKRLRIKGLIRDWKVDVVCLMETKMEVILERWFAVCGDANMWIGVIWGLVGRQVEF